MDSQEACQGPRGVTRQYQIRFQIGSFKVYESVNTTACRAERCSHTYNLLNVDSIPSSYDSVSVAAMNVVGVGPARTCTAQTISELQFIMCSNIVFKLSIFIGIGSILRLGGGHGIISNVHAKPTRFFQIYMHINTFSK